MKTDMKIEMKSNDDRYEKLLAIPAWVYVAVSLVLKSNYPLSMLYDMNGTYYLFGLFAAVIPVAISISISFFLKGKAKRNYLFFTDLILSILLFADAVYARSFGKLLSVRMLQASSVLDGLGSGVLSLLKPGDFILFLDLPLLFWIFKHQDSERQKRNVPRGVLAFVMSLTLTFGYTNYVSQTAMKGNQAKWPLAMSPLGSHLHELFRITQDENVSLTRDEVDEISTWHEENAKYLGTDPQYQALAGSLEGKNLIAIHFESLENFVIGQEVMGCEITPNINALLDESLYFSNVIEQTQDGNSSDAELLFNTSMYPLADGSAFILYGDHEYNSLPILLKESGYTSLAIHGDDKTYWNRDQVYPKLGFADYIDETRFADTSQIGLGIDDAVLFDESLNRIRTLSEPYYFSIITVTSHMPFELPEEKQMLSFEETNSGTDYLQSIHYVDSLLGDFIRTLDEEGLLENSAVIIYGDHEGVHKYYETDLPENNQELPFIIYSPGMEGQEITNHGGQIDMLPTLLSLMGTDQTSYQDTVMGRNLLGTYTGSAISAEGEMPVPTDGADLLKETQEIADLAIKGKYYERQVKVRSLRQSTNLLLPASDQVANFGHDHYPEAS